MTRVEAHQESEQECSAEVDDERPEREVAAAMGGDGAVHGEPGDGADPAEDGRREQLGRAHATSPRRLVAAVAR